MLAVYCSSLSSLQRVQKRSLNIAGGSSGPGPTSRQRAAPRELWYPIDQPLIWQGSEDDALNDTSPTQNLSPAWKVILLSDGSVTRHLKLMTNLDVHVDCIEMHDLGSSKSRLPAGVDEIRGPWLRRQVFLKTPNHSKIGAETLVYAASWWNADEAKQWLAIEDQPIWISLLGSELRREIQYVYLGTSKYLEEEFKTQGPFWGRQYVFYRGGRPLTLIYEVFSPSLQQYLGDMHAIKNVKV